MATPNRDFERSVFISGPSSEPTEELFQAAVFAVQIAGLIPRSALEASRSSSARLEKILAVISECRFGVHDISHTDIGAYELPQFNLPLELGLDLGCQRYGPGPLASKRILVFDKKAYRYQRFLSDLVGHPIYSHSGKPQTLVRRIGDWLTAETKDKTMPSGRSMASRYLDFREDLPGLYRRVHLGGRQLGLGEYSTIVRVWLEETDV